MTKNKVSTEVKFNTAKHVEFVANNPEWQANADLIYVPPTWDEIAESYEDASTDVLDRCMEFIGPMVTRGAMYIRLRKEGNSHNWAAMCALQKGPALSTDDTFFQGSKPLYDQFESQKHLDGYLKESAKRGFVPNKNAVYFPGIARFRGDPEAYVTRAQGRTYIKGLLERRGWACEGAVKTAHRQPEDDPLAARNCVRLADNIIIDRAKTMQKQDPSVKRMSRQALREKIIAEHGASA